MMDGRALAVSNGDYMVAGMMLMFGIMAAMLYRSRLVVLSRLKNFFTSRRTYNVQEEMEEGWVTAIAVFLFTCISVVCLSILFFNGGIEGRSGGAVEKPYWLYGACFLVGMVFIYAKACLYQLVNWTFFDPESNRIWLKGYLFITSLTALLLYPLALLDVFSDLRHDLFTASAILVVTLYESLLFYKLVINFKVKKYGYVFIFLYFCSVEVLPTLVFGHLAIWFNINFIETNILY